jgi:mRNA interferase MazF
MSAMNTETTRMSLSHADCERIQKAANEGNLYIGKPKSKEVRRGQVYIADLGTGQGSEQQGIRPVLIIQNDIGNHFGSTVLVVPITSQNKREMPTHFRISSGTAGLTKDSTALVEQMRTVDKSRLKNCIGCFTADMMNDVNSRIMIQVGIG